MRIFYYIYKISFYILITCLLFIISFYLPSDLYSMNSTEINRISGVAFFLFWLSFFLSVILIPVLTILYLIFKLYIKNNKYTLFINKKESGVYILVIVFICLLSYLFFDTIAELVNFISKKYIRFDRM
jgi:hypothetical protein